jgi:hypothetical protein
MLTEEIKALGAVSFELTDEFGNVKDSGSTNLIVNTGLSYITGRILSNTTTPVGYMALGIGTTAVSLLNTGLETPLGPRILLTDASQVTTNVLNDSVQYTCAFAAGVATGGITEAALYNDELSGIMVARTVFPVINKGPLDVLAIIWKITIY